MYGIVAKNQVPMLITFDEEEAEFIGETLGEALRRSYDIIDFFTFDEGDGEW